MLDVGCATQWPRADLPATTVYIGVDSPQTGADYATRPAVWCDAHALPFADATVSVVLMLDVMEHLRNPEEALAETLRVLRPGGNLILSVPFLYPLHDQPNDYTRWTEAGLRAVAERTGFEVREILHRGHPVQTAGLLFNIGLAHSALVAVRERRLGALLSPLVPAIVLAMNLLAWGLARLLGGNSVMPHSYQAIWVRPPMA